MKGLEHKGFVMKSLLFAVLLVGCGAQEAAQQAAKEEGSDKKVDTKENDNPQPVEKPVEKEEAKEETTPGAQKQPSLTQDQKNRATIRMGFDSLLAADKLFHDESFKAYFLRSEVGTMGYPDTSSVAATTKNVLYSGCPLGFKQTTQIELGIGKSNGLFDKLPPEADWVWSSSKTGDSYYALSVIDQTDPWGYSFVGGLFYARHARRIIGQLYCMMNEADLPNVDDIPEGYMDLIRGR